MRRVCVDDCEAAYGALGFSLPGGEDPVERWGRMKDTSEWRVGAFAPDGWAGLAFVADDGDIFGFRVLAVPEAWWATRDPKAGMTGQVEKWFGGGSSWWRRFGLTGRGYHAMSWEMPDGGPWAEWEWGEAGERAAVARLRLSKASTVVVQCYCPWSRGVAKHLSAYAPSRDGRGMDGRSLLPVTRDGLRWGLAFDRAVDEYPDAGGTVSHAVLHGVETLRLAAAQGGDAAGTSVAARGLLEGVEGRLAAGRRGVEAGRTEGGGALEGAAEAITQQLGWTEVYTPARKRTYVTVSRRWVHANNSAPDFLWDSFLNAVLVAQDDVRAARETVRSVLSWQHASGMLPQYGEWIPGHEHWASDTGWGHTQFPIGSLCVAKLHARFPDPAFLREVYPKLLRFNRWWFADRGDGQAWRDGNGNGLLELGSNYPPQLGAKARRQRACFESYDDSPMWFDEAVYNEKTQTLEIDTVERNCLYASDCLSLAWIADRLGETTDAAMLRAEHTRMREAINRLLWNEARRTYLNRRWAEKDGEAHFPHVSPDVFFALLGEVADAGKAESLRRMFHDPKKFAGTYLMPTISRDDPAYPDQDYWRGKVWAPVNWLVLQGLRLAGWRSEAATLAKSGADLFLRGWREHGWCCENYLATTGEGSSDKHYTWGALLALGLIEQYADVSPWEGLRFGSVAMEPGSLRRWKALGRSFDVTVDERGMTVDCDGARLFEVTGRAELREVELEEGRVVRFSAYTEGGAEVRVNGGRVEALPVGMRVVECS